MNSPAMSHSSGCGHAEEELKIAIVGAGPSGCYTAQALRKSNANTEIAVFDAKPTPYGLVRYGIAPDHQGAKAVIRQFERVFMQPGVSFLGNVTIGEDLSWEELHENFDAIIVATGLASDRKLEIKQSEQTCVIGAGDVIRYLNSDPDSRLRNDGPSASLGETLVILGTGNVAIDVARLLSKSDLEFIDSDVDDDALRTVAPTPLKEIYILGRCHAENAKWDTSMLKELADLPGVQVWVDDVLISSEVSPSPRTTIFVNFSRTPTAIEQHAGRVRVSTCITGSPDQLAHVDADAVITALGFESGLVGEHPRSDTSRRTFRVGGPATGRLGNLAENRKHALETAKSVLAQLDGSPRTSRPGVAGLPTAVIGKAVTFDAWKAIDDAEMVRARPDRCRTKFTTRAELIAVANSHHTTAPRTTTSLAHARQEI